MTNPLPQPGPADSSPTDTALTGSAGVSSAPARKAPRRASAPAGPPKSVDAPALIIVSESGAVLSTAAPVLTEMYDAGEPVAPESSASAGVGEETSVGTEAQSVAEARPEGDAESEVETESKPAIPASAAAEEAPETEATHELSVDAPVTLPETVLAPVPVEASVSTNELDPTPQSRRERRMAEQKQGTTPTAAATVKPVVPKTAAVKVVHSDPLTASGPVANPGRKPNRLVGMLRGMLFLVVISALVVALGTIRSGKDDPTAGPSQTEAHRQAAWESTSVLLQQAAEVRDSGQNPKLVQLLADVGEDLTVQLAALGNGLPPVAATASVSVGATVPASLEQVVTGLQTNGTKLLDNAVSADHAMGRVFAAVGTNQLLQGRALGDAAGLTPQGTPWLPATVHFPTPSGPECSSTLEPRPGATVDAALIATAQGEQKAIYAYEVAAPRLANGQFGQAEKLLAGHREKLALLNAELQVRCLPTIQPAPAFTLNPDFISAPSAALAGLEGELAASYADLAALSTAPVSAHADLTPAAIPHTTEGSVSTQTPAASPEPTSGGRSPGIAATTENTSMLRQLSVTWLLDSTASVLVWGGIPSALPGLEESVATTAP